MAVAVRTPRKAQKKARKNYWTSLTPAQRKKEMKRRRQVALDKKKSAA